jgi:transcriptional regulator with XRE-family HTH domain
MTDERLEAERAEILRAITERRKDLGLRLVEVAEQVGMDGSYASRVERGLHDMGLRTLLRYLEAVGLRMVLVTPDWAQAAYEQGLTSYGQGLETGIAQGLETGRERAREDILEHRQLAGSMGSDDFVDGLELAAEIATRGLPPWDQTAAEWAQVAALRVRGQNVAEFVPIDPDDYRLPRQYADQPRGGERRKAEDDCLATPPQVDGADQ